MFPEGFKQCLLTEPISLLVPTKHIITQVSRLACRKQGLKGKGPGTRRAFLVALSGEDSGSSVGRRGGSHGLEIWAVETQILPAVLFLSKGVIWPPKRSVLLSVKQGSSNAGRGP